MEMVRLSQKIRIDLLKVVAVCEQNWVFWEPWRRLGSHKNNVGQ